MAAMDYVTAVAILLVAIEFSSSQAVGDITNMRLKKLLDTSYDKERAPVSAEGDLPLKVTVNFHLRQLTLRESDLMMSLDIVDVIQSWVDPRLAAVTHETRDLDLYKSQVNQVWKPDIHVVNGHQQLISDHVTLTLSKSGLVTFQQSMLIGTLCPNFTSHMKPLVCSVQIQPYSHTRDEIVYEWGSVTNEPQLLIPKYTLISMETTTCPPPIQSLASGLHSCQQLSMSFYSDVNFFATEIYGASVLLVALSWTGFWVKTDNPLQRLCLGLLIVLVLVIYSVGFRLLHNKVGVAGNVEVWVAFCTLFVLASLIEYVFVHVLLRNGPSQLRRLCCKRCTSTSLSTEHPSTRNGVICSSGVCYDDCSAESSSYEKAARAIDVTCGLLFPLIFILFNVAYWITY